MISCQLPGAILLGSSGKSYPAQQQIHTNPNINVEAPLLRAGGPNGFSCRLHLWHPGLTKAPLGAGVEKNEPVPSKDPKRDKLSKFAPYKKNISANYIGSSYCAPLLGQYTKFNWFSILERSLGKMC